jgi:hypothetical protein
MCGLFNITVDVWWLQVALAESKRLVALPFVLHTTGCSLGTTLTSTSSPFSVERIKFTYRLGFKYLCIDALCIIHNSAEDLQKGDQLDGKHLPSFDDSPPAALVTVQQYFRYAH